MDITKSMQKNNVDTIENYELIVEKTRAVLTYELRDSQSLKNIADVFILAKQQSNGGYHLVVSSEDGQDLVILENLDKESFNNLIKKKIFIAGINQDNGEIETVVQVLNMAIEKQKKNTMY